MCIILYNIFECPEEVRDKFDEISNHGTTSFSL